MKSYGLMMAALCLLILLLFAFVSALDIPWLSDPQPLFDRAGWWASIGALLLIVDVALPIPSSLVMIAHGALFGLVWGTVVSLLGATGAAVVGFYLGGRAKSLVQRFTSEEDRQRADELLHRWGVLAVIVTRPVPVMAESVAILAGTSSLSWSRFLLASMLGNLPTCAFYAATGAAATALEATPYALTLLLVVITAGWLAVRMPQRPPVAPSAERSSTSSTSPHLPNSNSSDSLS